MRSPRILWCVAVCVLALQSAAAELKFSTSRYSTLPLLSVPLSLSYQSGDEWVRLAPTIEVQLLPLDGREPVVTWRGLVDLGADAEGEARLVKPGERVDVVIPAMEALADSWATNAKAKPGRWQLRVLVFDEEGQRVAISNKAHITIEIPKDVDAEVWSRLQRGELAQVAADAQSRYGQSRYYPYLVPSVPRVNFNERIALVADVLERFPDTPLRARLMFIRALEYDLWSRHAAGVEHDFGRAIQYADEARESLARIERLPDAHARRQAARKREEVPGREYFEFLRERHAVEEKERNSRPNSQ